MLLMLCDVYINFLVCKNWFGKIMEYVYVINGIDLQICCGEILGIVGELGCGKSIFVQFLMGML